MSLANSLFKIDSIGFKIKPIHKQGLKVSLVHLCPRLARLELEGPQEKVDVHETRRKNGRLQSWPESNIKIMACVSVNLWFWWASQFYWNSVHYFARFLKYSSHPNGPKSENTKRPGKMSQNALCVAAQFLRNFSEFEL